MLDLSPSVIVDLSCQQVFNFSPITENPRGFKAIRSCLKVLRTRRFFIFFWLHFLFVFLRFSPSSSLLLLPVLVLIRPSPLFLLPLLQPNITGVRVFSWWRSSASWIISRSPPTTNVGFPLFLAWWRRNIFSGFSEYVASL